MSRNVLFAEGEYYHVYNRGVEKRDIALDEKDRQRFIDGLRYFNAFEPIGSIYELNRSLKSQRPARARTGKPRVTKNKHLVDIVAYCLNPNHYHLLLRQNVKDGVSKFLQRLAGGYTMYFNERHKRSGALFQGKFKAVHIATNEQLLHVSAYINLNPRVHRLTGKTSRTSMDAYLRKTAAKEDFCRPRAVLEQFRNGREYLAFSEDALSIMLKRKDDEREYATLLAE